MLMKYYRTFVDRQQQAFREQREKLMVEELAMFRLIRESINRNGGVSSQASSATSLEVPPVQSLLTFYRAISTYHEQC